VVPQGADDPFVVRVHPRCSGRGPDDVHVLGLGNGVEALAHCRRGGMLSGSSLTLQAEAGIAVRHVVLHASRTELVRRIEADSIETSARQWRLDHLDAYDDARTWLDGATCRTCSGSSPDCAATIPPSSTD
jgi:hypothetical protein